MEAKYHIITDIECRILHYGTEIGVASPGEDSFIMLKKGKHMLSFVSAENEQDSYKVVLEVPENDIEDFIEVKLAPYRDLRLQREEEERQLFLEEERKREQEQRHQAEEKKKKEIEEQKRQERLIRVAEEYKDRMHRFELSLTPLNSYLEKLLANSRLEDLDTPQLIPIWINRKSGEISITDGNLFEWDFGYRYAIVTTKLERGHYNRSYDEIIKWCYKPIDSSTDCTQMCFNRAFIGKLCVDEHFSEVYHIDGDGITVSSYALGVAFSAESLAKKGQTPSPYHILIQIIDREGVVLFKETLGNIVSVYEPLPFFPFHIDIQGKRIPYTINISYKTQTAYYKALDEQLSSFDPFFRKRLGTSLAFPVKTL